MILNLKTSRKSFNFNRTYPFTNENITSYENIFDFSGADVLSVIGSGDQYFASLLYGAENVDLFDINMFSAYYFILKFMSIKILSYEEFIKFFVTSHLSDKKIYNKVNSSLPSNVRIFFDHYFKFKGSLENLINKPYLNYQEVNFNTGRVIPYFERNKYYELKSILKEVKFPRIYIMDLVEDLPKYLDKKYDIMLFSNIEMYTGMSDQEFVDFLKNKYYFHLKDGGVIQANYCWFDSCETKLFDIREIDSIKLRLDENSKDYVLSLRK